MAGITTHVLDTARGSPAREVAVVLEYLNASPHLWQTVATGKTNADGRSPNLLPPGHVLAAGTYRMTFETGPYFAGLAVDGFYPQVEIIFTVKDALQHYHVPLLLSPFGFSTYRGS